MSLFNFDKTVGVIGIGSSGKTVFLTSLISHLKNHHPNELRLDSKEQDAEIIKFQESPIKKMDLGFFEHEKFYNTFKYKKSWPEKTSDSAYYHCQFERNDWKWTSIDLNFLDFPGERFNDVLMMGKENDYATWSDAVLARIENDPVCKKHAQGYFEVLEQEMRAPLPSKHRIIEAYKVTLAKFMQGYGAFITPSVFALDTKGTIPTNDPNPEVIAEGRLTGCDQQNEFAPLPKMYRLIGTGVNADFSEYYELYRKEIVRPQFNNLRRCHTLLVLVDIPGLLTGHVGRFNDTEHVIGDVLSAVTKHRQSEGVLSRLWEFGFDLFSFDRLEKIAFVATKSDIVAPKDIDILQVLLKELVWQKVKNHPEIPHKFFTCSAIRSTVVNKQGQLEGFPVWNSDGKKNQPPGPQDTMTLLNPSNVPHIWPEYWDTDQYFFPEVWPILPARKSMPPRQDGMGAILNFIFN